MILALFPFSFFFSLDKKLRWNLYICFDLGTICRTNIKINKEINPNLVITKTQKHKKKKKKKNINI